MLEFTYQIPVFLLCGYLYLTFRHCFSKPSSRNIILVAWLMTGMNLLTMSMRFFYAFKEAIVPVNMFEYCLIPLGYGLTWLVIFVLTYLRDGEYNAPPSLFYMQEEETKRRAKEQLMEVHGAAVRLGHVPVGFIEGIVKKSGLGVSSSRKFLDESTRDMPRMLNFEDTEEEPLVSSRDSLQPLPFDHDIESMDLF